MIPKDPPEWQRRILALLITDKDGRHQAARLVLDRRRK